MNKPIIGIIGRKAKTDDLVPFDANVIPYDYMMSLDKAGANYLCLITNQDYKDIDEEILSMCDGFLLPGGSEIKPYHYKIIDYALHHKIPFLGICMGCQAIGLYFLEEKKLTKIDDIENTINHKGNIEKKEDRSTLTHAVTLKEGSILYNLFGPTIQTNGRHNYCLTKVEPPLEVIGTTEDGIIEAIELNDKNHFMVGVQWHPESLENMQPLFDEFIKESYIYKEMRGGKKWDQMICYEDKI